MGLLEAAPDADGSRRVVKTTFLLMRKIELAFGSAIVILLVVGTLSYRSMLLSTESTRWVQHTHEVLENLQGLLFAVSSIEGDDR